MIILTVNAGSSSIRLDAFIKKGNSVERFGGMKYNVEESSSSIPETFMGELNLKEISLVSHRIVHGGIKFVNPCLISPSVEKEIDLLSSLAPLHNPSASKWIQTCRGVFGNHVPQVAVFDTAFYSTLPEASVIYALPQSLCKKYNIRRYGFHGIAHSAMWKRWKELRPDLKDGRSFLYSLAQAVQQPQFETERLWIHQWAFRHWKGL